MVALLSLLSCVGVASNSAQTKTIFCVVQTDSTNDEGFSTVESSVKLEDIVLESKRIQKECAEVTNNLHGKLKKENSSKNKEGDSDLWPNKRHLGVLAQIKIELSKYLIH